MNAKLKKVIHVFCLIALSIIILAMIGCVLAYFLIIHTLPTIVGIVITALAIGFFETMDHSKNDDA